MRVSETSIKHSCIPWILVSRICNKWKYMYNTSHSENNSSILFVCTLCSAGICLRLWCSYAQSQIHCCVQKQCFCFYIFVSLNLDLMLNFILQAYFTDIKTKHRYATRHFFITFTQNLKPRFHHFILPFWQVKGWTVVQHNITALTRTFHKP
jgi:hypothetical protein